MKKCLLSFFTLLFAAFILFGKPGNGKAQIGENKKYPHAAVVSAKKSASEIGKEILQMGGNAVDAAVAINFALAVNYPRAGNIGGGGPRIINAVLQMFLNVAMHKMDAQQAIAMPRIHHQHLPNFIYYESFTLGEHVKEGLRNKGHRLKRVRDLARAHILHFNSNGWIETGVDPRGNGGAAGY